MFIKHFDEYEIGETWTSEGRTITEADIVNFASLSGDWYPLHTNAEYAKSTPFKQRIAHGLLVLSAASGLQLFKTGVVVAFYGMEDLRFLQPTFIGDTIHINMTVTELKDKGKGTGIVTARQEIMKQTGETVVVATVKVLINK
ncbi:dehydratase [Bacillaceae bacterium SAS-127]|nr:dehydratase [Bacillaceae bacterium SAS-127]